jgi:hypothetical protein
MTTILILIGVPILALIGNGAIEILKHRDQFLRWWNQPLSSALKELMH